MSLLLFLVSAQIEQSKISDATENALDPGPFPLTGASTILVLGSDTRPAGSKEPGAQTTGNGRSDSILLLRVGGGKNSRMSIARDTQVEIRGAGRQKINAAYAIGGAPLAIDTVKNYLGIEVNHIIEVSFSEFPDLIDAMGGIDYKGTCVRAKVNGGARNGGVTIRIKGGKEVHLNGKQALALARVRKNACRPNENDLNRAARQQKILASMKSRVFSIHGFARLPVDLVADPAHLPHRHERTDARRGVREPQRPRHAGDRRARHDQRRGPRRAARAAVEKFLDE